MASDDTLLIFKMRGMSSETQKPKDGEVAPYKEELPMVEPQPAPKEVARKPKPVKQPEQAIAQAQKAVSLWDEYVRKKQVARAMWEEYTEKKEEKASIYHKEGDDYPNPMDYYKEALESGRQGAVADAPVKNAPRGRADSREKARRFKCFNHPSRQAYAVCAYCHRPFCFEDIVEYQKDYYCTEDIDFVESRRDQRLTNEYGAAGILTSLIMLASFVIFMYYAHGQLVYTFNYIIGNPLSFFTNLNANLSYIVGIGTLVAMVASFATAFYILLGSKKGHVMASILAVVIVMMVTYQYLGTGTAYFAIIAIFEFAAFLSAVHSAASGTQVYSRIEEMGPEYILADAYRAY